MRTNSFIRPIPAALAGLLALAGVLGWGPTRPEAASDATVLIDASASVSRLPASVSGLRFDTSDLAKHLRAAVASGAKRIELYTDGCHTGTGPLISPGVPVDVHLLDRADDFQVLSVVAPPRVGTGDPLLVEVEIGRTAGPGEPATVGVRLERDGARIGSVKRISVGRGQRRRVVFPDSVDDSGVVRYRATLVGAPGDPANDFQSTRVRVGSRPLVVVVGELDPGAGFETVSTTPEHLSGRLQDLQDSVDLVVVAKGVRLADAAQEAVRAAVLGGAGLLVLGGSGFGGRPLESVLPVTDRPPAGRAILLLLDFSGSMEPWKARLQSAVSALRSRFHPDDVIAAIGFRSGVFDEKRWTAVKDANWDLSGWPARGRTRIAPALNAAQRSLSRRTDAERRVYIVSDGEWLDSPEKFREASERAAEWRRSGVHAAAVFVGSKIPAPAAELFPIHFLATDEISLVNALEEAEASAPDRSPLHEQPVERAPAPRWLADAVPELPTVRDIDRLYAMGRGESVVLHAGRWPVLAAFVPAGRVIVWNAPYVPEPLAGLMRACARQDARSGALRATRAGPWLILKATAMKTAATFVVNGQKTATRTTGPETYEARVRATSGAAITVRFLEHEVVVPGGPAAESAGLFVCRDAAAALARGSGGRLIESDDPQTVADKTPSRLVQVTLLAAAAALLLSAFVRRSTNT
ncbi:MAG: vWA domain-containing protein [Planctomycetota bacterium]